MTEQHLSPMDAASALPRAKRREGKGRLASSAAAAMSDRTLLHKPTSLTRRLTILAFLFVMVAEVLIYVPSIARYQESWLNEKVTAAYLAVLLAEAMPGFMIENETKEGLLDAAGVMAIDIYRDDQKVVELTPLDMDVMPDTVVDLRTARWYDLIRGSYMTMVRNDYHVISVLAPSPKGEVLVRVMINEEPLRVAMYEHSARIFWLSIVISSVTALLLVLALRWQIVKPVKRLIQNMLGFARDPSNPANTLEPSLRRDELGAAEEALHRMQKVVRQSLRQQQRLAELGTAVSKISHDLRNILTTADLLADFLQQSDDPNVQRIAPRLIASLDRANNLCTESMQFGKIEEPDPHPEIFDLHPLADEVAVAAGAHPISPVQVVCRFDKNLQVYADREMLFRILLNLLRNAVQALERMKLDAPQVELLAATNLAGNLEIIVKDNGTGLPPKAQENLFRPFHASTGQGGTGLGLVIALELCRAQQGDLDLVETGETGTIFRITLPQASQ